MESRLFVRAAKRIKLSPIPVRRIPARLSSSSSNPLKSPTQQAIPIGDYYASILSSPTYYSTPRLPLDPPTPPKEPVAKILETNPVTAANPEPSILFASRTVKLRERQEELSKKSVKVAGIWVPPKPEEPDDCCMSGCVNCVWDRYQEEMEEYVLAKNAADKALVMGKKGEEGIENVSGTGLMIGQGVKGAGHTQASLNAGGGSEGNWGVGIEIGEDLYKGVPPGIREFMKLEKSLKEKTKNA